MDSVELNYEGEVVLVAGGGGSLGGAYARLFGARGAKVIVNDVDEGAQKVADAINEAGGTAIAVIASVVTDAAAIVQRALDCFGRLDVVVNSAGQTNGGLFHLIDPEDWNRVFDSHFTGTLALARAAWPHLSASGNGRLINTSSTSTFGAEYSSTYIAAKGAIFTASKAWSLEGKAQNIRVNTIMPTAISQMTAGILDPQIVKLLEDEFQPEKVAGLVVWLAHKSNTVTGQTFEVGGGRATHVLMAVAKPAFADDPTRPESWAPLEAELCSTIIDYVPSSMIDELRYRLQTMKPEFAAMLQAGMWATPDAMV